MQQRTHLENHIGCAPPPIPAVTAMHPPRCRTILLGRHSSICSSPSHRMSLTTCFGLLLLSLLATEVEPGKKLLLLKGLFEGIRYSAVTERRRFAEARLGAYTRLARLLHPLNQHLTTVGKRLRTEAIRSPFLKEIFPRERTLLPIQRSRPNKKNVVLRDSISSTDALGWAFPPIVGNPVIEMGKQMEPGSTEQRSPVNKKHQGSHLVVEPDLLEDLVFDDIELEDVTASQFDLRRHHVFNDAKLEDFVFNDVEPVDIFNEEQISSSIFSILSIPPLE